MGQKTVHWSSAEGIALESSLLLSDSAQKYAIAREMCKADSHHVSIQTFLNLSACFAYYYMVKIVFYRFENSSFYIICTVL